MNFALCHRSTTKVATEGVLFEYDFFYGLGGQYFFEMEIHVASG